MTDNHTSRPADNIDSNDPFGRKLSTTKPDIQGWAVRTGDTPFAVQSSTDDWPLENFRELHSYAGGVAWAVHNLGEEWDRVTSTVDVSGYRLKFRVEPIGPDLTPWGDEEVPPLPTAPGILVEDVILTSSAGGTLAEWIFRVDLIELLRAVHHDAQSAHLQLGVAVSNALQRSGIEPAQCEEFKNSWNLTRATFTARMGSSPTIQANLPAPWKLDSAFLAATKRQIAAQLMNADVTPGLYTSHALKALDNTTLAPAALALLQDKLAAHDLREICLIGLEQINRCVSMSASIARNIEQSAQAMDLDWDPIDRLRENEREYVNLRMCCEACIEAAMRVEPAGTTPLDQVAWQEIIAAAFGYIEATNRSESIHHQVTPVAVRITEYYEIEVERSDRGIEQQHSEQRVYDLDVEAYQLARAEYNLGLIGGPSNDEVSSSVDIAELEESGEHPSIEEALRRIDAGMMRSFGCTATDVMATLRALALWPMTTRTPSVEVVERDQVVEHVLSYTSIGDDEDGVERVSKTIDMLTSNASRIQAADWRPWQVRTRRDRLLVRPLVDLGGSEIAVAPHYCHGSANAYVNYLTQGLLPWSSPTPPRLLDRALADYREERNRALERQVSSLLRAAGYTVRARVKPQDAGRIGLENLEGEIDDLAGRPESDIIWLLEVKDPADVIVTSDIRRSLDRFYVGGRQERPYVEMLEAKAADIESRIDAVAAALGLPGLEGGSSRRLRTIFVTRAPNTAAFVGGKFPFVTAKALISYMHAVENV